MTFPNPDSYTLPTIHLNGSNAASLAANYQTAYEAALQLHVSMGMIDHNARDYYPQGDAAWPKAQREFVESLDRVHKVSEFLKLNYYHCQEAVLEGKR